MFDPLGFVVWTCFIFFVGFGVGFWMRLFDLETGVQKELDELAEFRSEQENEISGKRGTH